MSTIAELRDMLARAEAAGDDEAVALFRADIAAAEKSARPAKQPELSPVRAALSGAYRGLASGLQGPSFGLADEALARLSATGGVVGQGLAELTTGRRFEVPDRYTRRRDELRESIRTESDRNPVASVVTRLAASAPLMVLRVPAAVTGLPAAVSSRIPAMPRLPAAIAPTASRMGAAAASGTGTGVLAGLGESEADTAGGVLSDAVGTGAQSGILAAMFPAVGGAVRGAFPEGTAALGANVAARGPGSWVDDAAYKYAAETVSQALLRDQPGRKTAAEMVRRGAAMGNAIGSDARIVDVGGRQTRKLLDTVATAPGSTAERVDQLKRVRKFNQFADITAPAERLILGRRSDYSGDLRDAAAARQVAAGPLYQQLEGVKFQVDDELATLLKRAEDYLGDVTRRSKVRGEFETLRKLEPGQYVSLKSLNTLKGSLYEGANAKKIAGAKESASEIHDLRIAIKNKIDELSPKDADGNSLARRADETWSGLESYRASIEAGRNAMKTDSITLADDMRGLSGAEREGFMIGAVQSLKDIAGTQAGRTRLLNHWNDKTVGGKLRELFGDDYNKFQTTLAGVERRKRLDGVGSGSQTFERLAGANDIDMGAITTSAATGNPGGIVSQLFAGMKTPEHVRDTIGRILLSSPSELRKLEEAALRVESSRDARAAASGTFSGLLPAISY